MSRSQLTPTLVCRNLTKSYHTTTTATMVLNDFSLSLARGEIGMLMGPSGCGKTTLLMTAGGILLPDKGCCTIYGQDVFDMPAKEKVSFRAQHISFLFQHLHLFPALSALENVALPLLLDGITPPIAYQEARQLMIRLGLEIHVNSQLDILSGGQKQRIAIGRALIRRSSLILCDEPTSSLDQDSAHLIFSIIKEYAKNFGCAFLICTHDHRITRYADTIIHFHGLANHTVQHQEKVEWPSENVSV